MTQPDYGNVAYAWWKRDIHADIGAARALAARLRRSTGLVEVLAEPAVYQLSQDLGLRDPARLTMIAQVLAAVKANSGTPAARAFGRGDSAALSQLRFQKLIRATDPADLSRALRRALPMIDATCNVTRLGRDLYWWFENEDARTRWCFDYFGAVAPAHEEERADT